MNCVDVVDTNEPKTSKFSAKQDITKLEVCVCVCVCVRVCVCAYIHTCILITIADTYALFRYTDINSVMLGWHFSDYR